MTTMTVALKQQKHWRSGSDPREPLQVSEGQAKPNSSVLLYRRVDLCLFTLQKQSRVRV